MPVYVAKAGGFFFIIFGVIALIAATVTINPIWNYGPYDPSPVSAGTQPDWYIGFADGALRLIPPGWEFVLFGCTLSFNILVPAARAAAVPRRWSLIYPFIEAWITGDKREHHIADRPRNAPTRTAIGAAGVTFYAVLWAAASSDLIATHFRLTIEGVTHALQVAAVRRPGHRLLRHEAHLHRPAEEGPRDRAARLRVRPHRAPARRRVHRGARACREYERWKLVDFDDYKPLMIRPNKRGRIPVTQRVRAVLSGWFFEDRIAPVTKTEIEARARSTGATD